MATENAKFDSFPKLLLRNARTRGESPAIREKRRGIWRTLTWRELADETAALAAALSARGLGQGGKMAFLGDNRPSLYAAMAAAHWLGAIAAPFYADATPEELAPLFETAGVTHAYAENQEQVDKLLQILPLCPGLRLIVYDKDSGMRHYKQPQLVAYAALAKEGRDALAANRAGLEAGAERSSGRDAATLIFTYGSTGAARGLLFTHEALIGRAMAAAATDGLNHEDVALAYLPPAWIGHHVTGYALSMAVGYCMCCPEATETLFADMREIGPTYFLATPRVLKALQSQVEMRMQDADSFKRSLYRGCVGLSQRVGAKRALGQSAGVMDRFASFFGDILISGPLSDVTGLSHIRAAYVCGEPASPDMMRFFHGLGVNLKQMYGSAEAGFVVAMQPDGQARADTVGRAAQGVEIALSPQREILVRSAGAMKEYFLDPYTTAQAFTPEGWLRTGDVGSLGEDGHLRVDGRLEDVGAFADGSSFLPQIVEAPLKFSPYVREAAAFSDGRDTVCALIDIDFASTAAWAVKNDVAFTGQVDLASQQAVYDLIAKECEKANAALAREPRFAGLRLRRFAIIPLEFSPDDGTLTRSRQLRRDAIAERYRPVVDAMFDGRDSASIEAATGEHGKAAALSMRIRDLPSAQQTTRKAA